MVQASLKRYFLTGLLVIIPIWGTILILKTLFVSLDPARDTPAALAKYLSHFPVAATGLTGKKDKIDAVVARYGAKYEIEKTDSALGYHINHSTYLYAIDSSGKVRFRFNHEDSADLIAAGVKRLLELEAL